MSFFETGPWGRACRRCGCDDAHACYDPKVGGGCHWVEANLCSVCAGRTNGGAAARFGGVAPLSARVSAAAYVQAREARRRSTRRWAAFYAAWAAILAISWVLS
ncbi:MAG: hypothetical protein OXF98_01970 [Rhodospirillaceae bacterium]|nr:hypothetical protein [Rhodospirillaceae bacterium]